MGGYGAPDGPSPRAAAPRHAPDPPPGQAPLPPMPPAPWPGAAYDRRATTAPPRADAPGGAPRAPSADALAVDALAGDAFEGDAVATPPLSVTAELARPAPHDPGVLRDYVGTLVRELWPAAVLRTVAEYLRDPRRFFARVFRDDFEGIAHPVSFVVAAVAGMVAITSLTGLAETPVTTRQALDALAAPDRAALAQRLGVPSDAPVMLAAGLVAAGLATTDSLPVDSVVARLDPTDRPLANALRVARGEAEKAAAIPDWAEPLLLHLVLLCWLVPFWRLQHRFLKPPPHRTPRQTVHVFMYTSGVMLVLLLPVVLLAGVQEEPWAEPLVTALQVPLGLYTLLVMAVGWWRHTQAVRATHGAGFWRQTWASVQVNVVVVGVLLALAAAVAGLAQL